MCAQAGGSTLCYVALFLAQWNHTLEAGPAAAFLPFICIFTPLNTLEVRPACSDESQHVQTGPAASQRQMDTHLLQARPWDNTSSCTRVRGPKASDRFSEVSIPRGTLQVEDMHVKPADTLRGTARCRKGPLGQEAGPESKQESAQLPRPTGRPRLLCTKSHSPGAAPLSFQALLPPQ